MADLAKCPVCGETNAADQEFCQYCQSRLQPLTGSLKDADAPLHPGQIPTKKVTAELEPILPQWLREARDKARQSVDDEASKGMEQQQMPSWPEASEPDLLAGLRSQSRSDEEEETPDWLANITGQAPRSRKSDLASSEGRRVELGGKEDFAQETAAPDQSVPSWLSDMQSAQPGDEKDELKDWFRESSGFDEKQESAPPPGDSAGWPDQEQAGGPGAFSRDQILEPSTAEAPDRLNQKTIQPEEGDALGSDMPSWLVSSSGADIPASSASPFAAAETGGAGAASQPEDGVPSWLQGFDSMTPTAGTSKTLSEEDWLKEHQPKTSEPPVKKHTTPLWLKSTDAAGGTAEESETPMWLMDTTSAAPIPPAAHPPEIPQDEGFGDIPNWLKAAAPQSSVFSEASAGPAQTTPSDTSDWLSSFKDAKPATSEPPSTPAFSTGTPRGSGQLPAFTEDAFQDGSVEGLFTEMPDWLTSAAVPSPSSGSSPLGGSDALTPGELPSWVQAMRPVEPEVSKVPPISSDQTIEARGALSGLQGVLPAVPGYKPSSKPKAYSIKLQATQEQQAHAALLEQILAAETEPVPITSFSPLRTSRGLRWMISVLVLVFIGGVTSLNTRVFSMPVGIPREFGGALAVAQNVPENSPVLVAMDYHPARAGEMEAVAAPMFDQMILLRHPRLSFISTNETGPILTERFMSGTLRERGYQYGNQYLNLGYLPGGVMGIRAFAQNPSQAMPFDISLELAWALSPLQGVSSLSQFSALIVVTDNADSARAWIEQTTSLRGNVPMVLISSAQAAPMLMPYYDSGQVSGMVNGLYGGAIFEQNNAGRPGTARSYWDAYSLGMLLAMSMMLAGGFWSMLLGLRERAAAREGK